MPGDWFPAFPNLTWAFVAFCLAIIWSAVWKGIALWRASRNADLPWFIALFIVNTVGILELIYLFAISPRKKTKAQLTTPA